MFAVTNVDDIVLLALYFGQARGDRAGDRRIVMGQYIGFGAILAVSVLAALGLRLLPESVVAYLGSARHRAGAWSSCTGATPCLSRRPFSIPHLIAHLRARRPI